MHADTNMYAHTQTNTHLLEKQVSTQHEDNPHKD